MKARRYREGTLTASEFTDAGDSEVNPDALGTIAGVRDFLGKVKRLRQEIVAPPGSLRRGSIAQIEYLTEHVEAFLRGPHNSQAAEHALVYLLHAACDYMHLLAELDDDAAAGGRRGKYLQARATSARSRKKMATLAGFQSVQNMMKFEDAQGLPRPRRPKKRSTKRR